MTSEPTLTLHETEADWLAARRKAITSSDVPPLLGCYPSEASRSYLNPFELWRRKREPQEPNPEMRLRFDVGHLLEDRIAREVEEREGVALYDLGDYATVRRGVLLSTPDRLIVPFLGVSWEHDPSAVLPEATGSLEIKTDAVQGVGDWTGEDGRKLRYAAVQLHVTMICVGVDLGMVATLFGMGLGFEIFPVVRDPRLSSLIVERAEEFMEFLLTDTPPTEKYLDDSEAVADSLRAIFDKESGETIDLGEEWAEKIERLEWNRAEIKSLEAQNQAIKNQAMLELGEATCGRIPGTEKKWKWATQGRKGHTVEPSESRVLRLVKQ